MRSELQMTNVKKIFLISWIVVICCFIGDLYANTDDFGKPRNVKCKSQNSKVPGVQDRLCQWTFNVAISQAKAISRTRDVAVSIKYPASHIQNPVVPGAERLEMYLKLLEGKSVGLTINQSSMVQGRHLVDVLLENKVDIERIYAPEHGFRGTADAGAKIEDQKDSKTGLSVLSLYGKKRKPSQEDLAGVDIMIFDIQDVGVRFYTFISTMHLMMEACAEAGIPMIVLDRPNPNGYYVDGPVREPEYKSFIGMHPIPVVYGMTIGELATMINGEGWLENGVQCDLTVIACENYDHTMTYDLPVAPSPNLPNLRSILLYPSLCFFEGTNVSIGRGTANQFQVIGHPDFAPGGYTFTPEPMPGAMKPKYDGVTLHGTNLSTLTTDEILEWRSINLSWLIQYYTYLSDKGAFFLENLFFDRLAGTAKLREQILAGWSEEEIRGSWEKDVKGFKAKRKLYLLYQDFE